jgi:hypothetical protein
MVKKEKKKVSANANHIEPKQSGGSTAAFPDVCETPSSSEPGPIPIPYPNIAKSSETSSGTKTVKIEWKEVSTKDGSSYKKSTGDEASTKKPLRRQSVEGLMPKVTRVIKKRPIWVIVSLAVFVLVVWVLLSNISITPKPVDLPSEHIISWFRI